MSKVNAIFVFFQCQCLSDWIYTLWWKENWFIVRKKLCQFSLSPFECRLVDREILQLNNFLHVNFYFDLDILKRMHKWDSKILPNQFVFKFHKDFEVLLEQWKIFWLMLMIIFYETFVKMLFLLILLHERLTSEPSAALTASQSSIIDVLMIEFGKIEGIELVKMG